ncbi:Transcription initiation factor TFIID, subunit TAF5 [Trachipleistophora hominis]|uniref:Transcription initiation factor TFIID, subunit TAF5 n=1 Tax=Trachipleistophora hominis TaxID=72359 RepID=L7JT56_TRAHO|nr:Transcription initiation factor TFIID, subunit TAF5 [Trachipleistophora hominis]
MIDDQGYAKLKAWIEDSLDQFRNDLMNLLYPLFIHIYLDLLFANDIKGAKEFFNANKDDFYNQELQILESICTPQHLNENTLVSAYRTNKYSISMGKYAFDLFINFLERNQMTQILVLVNQYLNIKVHQGIKKNEEIEGLTEKINKNITLDTNLYSSYTEEAILKDEQYRYDHLESFVLGLKNRNREKEKVMPSSSFIKQEIENLKDLCKRVSLNKNNLPSVCCYTVNNTFERVCCAEISKDLKLLALGYSDSVLEIHALEGTLKKLKNTADLMKLKNLDEDLYEDIGKSTRLIGHTTCVLNVKFFNSKKYVLSCDMDRVYLWSLDLFCLVSTYKACAFPIWSLAISNNDLMFCSGGADRTVSLFNIDSFSPERLFTSALSDVSSLVFHPNSQYVIFGSCDHRIRMHEIESAELVRVFIGHTDTVTALAVSPDGKLLLSGSKDRTVILWDIMTSKKVNVFKGHTKTVYSVSFCYFGNVFVSCGADLSLRVWDFKNMLAVYHTKNTPLIDAKFGFRNIVSCVGPYQG